MRIARTAAALAMAALLTGCSGSQVARSRITPGRTTVQRESSPPTSFNVIIRPLDESGQPDRARPVIILRPSPAVGGGG